MNEEPATDTQLRRLQKFGHPAGSYLTRGEAARLLHEYELRAAQAARPTPPPDSEALQFRRAVEHLKIALAEALPKEEAPLEVRLETARHERIAFWIDTCRDPTLMREASHQKLELYIKQGCRFNEPTREQVQEVLEALDSVSPVWDAEHPELFYQTLELNFDLLRVPA